jgi:hypothetical protein
MYTRHWTQIEALLDVAVHSEHALRHLTGIDRVGYYTVLILCYKFLILRNQKFMPKKNRNLKITEDKLEFAFCNTNIFCMELNFLYNGLLFKRK